jgi:cytochrome b subunit of formate dehydrogenase
MGDININIEPLFFGILFFIGFLTCCYNFICDLIFYKRNNWNFDIDSGRRGSREENGESVEYGNRDRVFKYYPFLIVVFLFGGVVATILGLFGEPIP